MPRSLRRVVESFALLALCAVLVPSPVHAQSLREQVIGTWTLVSWTRFVGDVEEPLSFGRDPVGQVMFAPDGHMCFNVMRRNRAPFTSREFQAGTTDEKAFAYDGYLGFCGRYDVDEQEHSVALRLDLSSYPNWTGTVQRRFVDVAGNRLRLRTPPISAAGKPVSNTVLWERVK